MSWQLFARDEHHFILCLFECVAWAAGFFCAQVCSGHIEVIQPLRSFQSQTLPQLWVVKAPKLSQGTQLPTFVYLGVCLHIQFCVCNFWAKQEGTSLVLHISRQPLRVDCLAFWL